ncbi:unnamed protein product [Xylocopa violacea]|uniref:Uncharacterized protein n=1 Tax=Xylocopa violacea TaxID=135666 RepID=A0ABP1P071_XYLVO
MLPRHLIAVICPRACSFPFFSLSHPLSYTPFPFFLRETPPLLHQNLTKLNSFLSRAVGICGRRIDAEQRFYVHSTISLRLYSRDILDTPDREKRRETFRPTRYFRLLIRSGLFHARIDVPLFSIAYPCCHGNSLDPRGWRCGPTEKTKGQRARARSTAVTHVCTYTRYAYTREICLEEERKRKEEGRKGDREPSSLDRASLLRISGTVDSRRT